mmetsp:Transcript_29857/g.62918  ORF Transcript_29857/g.62918 Transcript_29857/m.62918 type:complete len:245 (-) Transcript_29857:13-747(-)
MVVQFAMMDVLIIVRVDFGRFLDHLLFWRVVMSSMQQRRIEQRHVQYIRNRITERFSTDFRVGNTMPRPLRTQGRCRSDIPLARDELMIVIFHIGQKRHRAQSNAHRQTYTNQHERRIGPRTLRILGKYPPEQTPGSPILAPIRQGRDALAHGRTVVVGHQGAIVRIARVRQRVQLVGDDVETDARIAAAVAQRRGRMLSLHPHPHGGALALVGEVELGKLVVVVVAVAVASEAGELIVGRRAR